MKLAPLSVRVARAIHNCQSPCQTGLQTLAWRVQQQQLQQRTQLIRTHAHNKCIRLKDYHDYFMAMVARLFGDRAHTAAQWVHIGFVPEPSLLE